MLFYENFYIFKLKEIIIPCKFFNKIKLESKVNLISTIEQSYRIKGCLCFKLVTNLQLIKQDLFKTDFMNAAENNNLQHKIEENFKKLQRVWRFNIKLKRNFGTFWAKKRTQLW